MNNQFKKGALDLCVLSLLAKDDYYGYQLIQLVTNEFSISEGTIYPILRRLSKEGYLETYMQLSSEGPSRKYYQLTEAGKDHLKQLRVEWENLKRSVDYFVLKGDR
ncbi:PadR family transcriptional regulator [Bacillus sp. JCM 19041]|uniref:PadR family transcriptional regulator n=1 Tax=Bacillus sp. JCM 19041 TaxID=1460637 RepID=UPI0006D1137D